MQSVLLTISQDPSAWGDGLTKTQARLVAYYATEKVKVFLTKIQLLTEAPEFIRGEEVVGYLTNFAE